MHTLQNKGQGKNIFSASNIYSKKNTQILPQECQVILIIAPCKFINGKTESQDTAFEVCKLKPLFSEVFGSWHSPNQNKGVGNYETDFNSDSVFLIHKAHFFPSAFL